MKPLYKVRLKQNKYNEIVWTHVYQHRGFKRDLVLNVLSEFAQKGTNDVKVILATDDGAFFCTAPKRVFDIVGEPMIGTGRPDYWLVVVKMWGEDVHFTFPTRSSARSGKKSFLKVKTHIKLKDPMKVYKCFIDEHGMITSFPAKL